MDKTCTKCGKLKSCTEYSLHSPAKKDGKLRPDCKECVRKRHTDKITDHLAFRAKLEQVKLNAIAQAKSYIASYLAAHSCIDCGEVDVDVLDFDHVQGTKVCDVSRMVSRGYRLWRIKDEVEKCEVRCANCHRRVTAKRRKIAKSA